MAGPFTGHSDWVNSVAFSPDGQWVVSGSKDQTIYVWNALAGEVVAGPFTGHTLLRYCRNVRPTWVKFNSKDTKESEWYSRF